MESKFKKAHLTDYQTITKQPSLSCLLKKTFLKLFFRVHTAFEANTLATQVLQNVPLKAILHRNRAATEWPFIRHFSRFFPGLLYKGKQKGTATVPALKLSEVLAFIHLFKL
ncbi:hypothetical protein HNQ91_001034 [Filimonas zeae]|uniref:hypothetical protein n=1 Tax=Filimonas zeae TaxID=1737353 RepID=UPI00166CBCFD|nr:hypothetical protein [Filimonas zeae]MDR6338012.1 hypothetical protein [Filimonas zeae]